MLLFRGVGIIGVTVQDEEAVQPYRQVLEPLGGKLRAILPGESAKGTMDGVGALLLDNGPDLTRDTTSWEADILCLALERDLPVLAIGRGMHVLNLALGGALPAETPHHPTNGFHQIYVSPGSKLAATLGSGGFLRVDSRHRLGLRDAQRALRLLSSAYAVLDGVVEGVESPRHTWVFGLQFNPHARETALTFRPLFLALVERAG